MINYRNYLKKHKLEQEYKKARNRVANAIKEAKRKYYRGLISSSQGNTRKLWKSINEVSGKVTKNRDIPFVKYGNNYCTCPKDNVNIFNEYFANVARNTIEHMGWPNEIVYVPHQKFIEFIRERLPPNKYFVAPHITSSFIEKELKYLNTNKAAGEDGISAKLLRASSSVIAQPLAKIINESLDTGIYPDEWKVSKVMPVFKSGSKDDVKNYRPISILSVISKIIERHVYNHFYDFFMSA